MPSWSRRRLATGACFGSRARLLSTSAGYFTNIWDSSRTCSATIPGRENGRGGTSRMHLTPREIDKLVLHQAGVLAQKRLARGLRLNYVEAVALIATQLLEFVRD